MKEISENELEGQEMPGDGWFIIEAAVQHTVTIGYGTDGRINSAGFLHGGAEKVFGYEYLIGSNLLHKLTKPNGMTLTQRYEIQRDLLTGMAYHRGTTLVANRQYSYDTLGRPTARNTARKGTVVNDTFAHNTRSELTAAQVNGEGYQYHYDNIGNRITATKGNESTTYTANALNQYTAIQENEEAAFTPLFDADGNQTRIKTETGIWEVIYNAENRPVSFTNTESNTVVECAYDSMGRRAYKKVTVNGNITLHQRYIYRGYLQIAALDLTRSAHPALWFITWDPTQPIATRPLSIRINGTWYSAPARLALQGSRSQVCSRLGVWLLKSHPAYGWDLTKNICELYSTGGSIATSYTYTPFGEVSCVGNVTQPIQWSSECHDAGLGMVYYNYRHYNPKSGRWQVRDKIGYTEEIYSYCKNSPFIFSDCVGNKSINPCDYELIFIAISSKSRIKISTKALGKAAEKIAEKITRELLYQIIKNINSAAKLLDSAATIVDHGLCHGYVVYGYRCECDHSYTVGIEKISGHGLDSSRDQYTAEILENYWLDVSIKRSEIKSLVESICCKQK